MNELQALTATCQTQRSLFHSSLKIIARKHERRMEQRRAMAAAPPASSAPPSAPTSRRVAPRGIVLRRPSPQRRSRCSIEHSRGGGRRSGRQASSRDAGKSVELEEAASTRADENAVQQQAVLESLASYLEGELMVRLQSYSELLGEVESLNKERLFYYGKLSRMEKVCERAQPYASSIPLVESVQKILAATTDRPDA